MTESLVEYFRKLIRDQGPITVARYFNDALLHPELGYYQTRDPLGPRGDFVTAPEISQVFGELIGLWCLQCWRQMGSPKEFQMVELGPGRGTLMADALRACRNEPAFLDAAKVHLIETNPILRKEQSRQLAHFGTKWHEKMDTLPTGRLILIANEFLDALPIHQFQFLGGQWFERLVSLNGDGQLTFISSKKSTRSSAFPEAKEAEIFETSPMRINMIEEIAKRLAAHDGYALFVDYGHLQSGLGETLQAVADHQFVPVLDKPGQADITSHVDFHALSNAAKQAGAKTFPAITQGRFLAHLGIAIRAERLLQVMPDEQQADFQDGVDRLISPDRMGEIFKVLALSHPDLPAPAGFEDK